MQLLNFIYMGATFVSPDIVAQALAQLTDTTYSPEELEAIENALNQPGRSHFQSPQQLQAYVEAVEELPDVTITYTKTVN